MPHREPRRRKPHKKPVGTSAAVQLAFSGPNEGFSLQQFTLSGKKDADELTVFRAFLRTGGLNEWGSYQDHGITQNQENDWDFNLRIRGETIAVELMEAAPASSMKRGGYAGADSKHFVTPYAREVYAGIKAKSDKYAKPAGRKLLLLVYVTHWSFHPSNDALELLSYWLKAEPHVFDEIHMHHFSGDEGMSWKLYPSAVLTPDFDPSDVTDAHFLVLNPNGAEARRLSSSVGADAIIFGAHLTGGRKRKS